MSDKWLFHFDVIREVTEIKEEATKNDKGEEVITKKEVREKKPITFAIRINTYAKRFRLSILSQ